MIKAFILIFYSIISQSTFAQQARLDSLLNALKKHPQEDTVRLNLLNDISYDYYQLNPLEGIATADKAIALSQKLNLPKKLATAYFYKGINLGIKGDYNNALEFLNRSVKILNDAGNGQQALKVQNSIAIIYMNLSDYEKALDIYFKNMREEERLKDDKMIALAAGNISILYERIGKLDLALQYNQKEIDIYKKLNTVTSLADAYAAKGNIYDNLNEPQKAIYFYQQGLQISKGINYLIGIANNMGNMGSVYGEIEKFDSAFYFTKKSLETYSQMGDKRNTSTLYGYLGDIIISSPKSILIKENILPEKKYTTALGYYQQSLTLSKEIGSVLEQSQAWKQISNVYKLQKKYEPALSAFENYIRLKDSVLNENKNNAVEKINIKYEFQKKEDSIKAANDKKMIIVSAEISKQKAIKKTIITGAIILLISSCAIFIFYKKNRDIKGQKVSAEFNSKVADTEMKALRSQMNPHFIFNSLNSISDYISKNDVHSADLYLTKFAKVMRMILENSEQKEVSLKDDLKALELYMQLESLRLNNKFDYEIKIDENIDVENTLVPPLILQPFVENSIWHGLSAKQANGHILIQIKKEGKMLNCIVEDNGIGRINSNDNSVLSDNKKPLGMKITKARIDIINKLKNSNAAVNISDLSEGMRAEVMLPLELSF
jgi:tetratricopeptide (TPR) repeat protein